MTSLELKKKMTERVRMKRVKVTKKRNKLLKKKMLLINFKSLGRT